MNNRVVVKNSQDNEVISEALPSPLKQTVTV